MLRWIARWACRLVLAALVAWWVVVLAVAIAR
jgi:hypothetical protein